MKVAYNTCWGGFSLSDQALSRYLQLKREAGIVVYDEDIEFNRDDIKRRSDPHLIQVIEELGESANGSLARLQIRDVPAGSRWRIDEYDGSETVRTVDDYQWEIAT